MAITTWMAAVTTNMPSCSEYAKLLKKVRRLGFNVNRVLIVDDTPAKVRNCYGNAIYPTPFLGNPDDNELVILAEYLEVLKAAENIRGIEKRQWQQQFLTDKRG
jgi:RNA polymerase II subunit A small phosphatase-like protein